MMRIKAGDGCMPRPPLIKYCVRAGMAWAFMVVGIGFVYVGHEIPFLHPNDIALLDI